MPAILQHNRGDVFLGNQQNFKTGQFFWSYINKDKYTSNGHSYSEGQLWIKDPSNENLTEIANRRSLNAFVFKGNMPKAFSGDFINAEDPLYADHCFLERITKDGKHLIYDTTSGFIYDKDLYWKMENPQVRKINKKSTIIEMTEIEDSSFPEDLERDKYSSTLILPIIEINYDEPTEMYSKLGIELLQREVEHYKKLINYDDIVKEVEDDMERLGFK